MIDPRELRIGNWAEGPHNKEPFQISHGEDIDHIQGNPSFNPIPLTEDILLKCGFVECVAPYSDQTAYVFGKDASRIVWCAGELYKFVSNSTFIRITSADYEADKMSCQCLHQLQNLIFCLVGEELEIDL